MKRIVSLLLVLILYPTLRISEKQQWFKKLLMQKSNGEVKRSMLFLFGMFTLIIFIAWGIFNKPEVAVTSIIMWGLGDAVAALVGIPLGKHKIKCRFTDGKKSWEGSIAMLIVSFISGVIAMHFLLSTSYQNILIPTLIASIVGTLTELFSQSEYDTIFVPIMIMFMLLII